MSGDVWYGRLRWDAHGWSRRSLGPPEGGNLESGISVASNPDGRLEAAIHSNEDTVSHAWQISPGGDWSSWISLPVPEPGYQTLAPVIAQNDDGHLEIFATVMDSDVWHTWQHRPGHGPWQGWHPLLHNPLPEGGFIQTPAVAKNHDGRLEAFAMASDLEVSAAAPERELWHCWQTAANNGWAGWNSLQHPPAPTLTPAHRRWRATATGGWRCSRSPVTRCGTVRRTGPAAGPGDRGRRSARTQAARLPGWPQGRTPMGGWSCSPPPICPMAGQGCFSRSKPPPGSGGRYGSPRPPTRTCLGTHPR